MRSITIKGTAAACAVLAIFISTARADGSKSNKFRRHYSPFPSAVNDRDYYDNGRPDPAQVALGKVLFYDKILSGNQNISCATCHHGLTGSGDGLSLPIGEGGMGLGITRDTGVGEEAVHERVPRNAPHVFNLGAKEFKRMFHDGRVVADPEQPSGFISPAGDKLPLGLNNPLAVQAMFPVTSATEMAGQRGENPIANAAADGVLAGPGGVWDLIAQRLRLIPEYVTLFADAFEDIDEAVDITYVHAANAIGAYEATAFRADNSPFDRFLRGDKTAMSISAVLGMRLFYGQAKCAECHSGKFQSDQEFHCIAMPQIGPGKGDGPDGRDDHGRARETLNAEDQYGFRTPTLRNVALTGPWGHDGAYNTLEAVVRHHLDPVQSLYDYDPAQAVLPSRPDLDDIDLICHNDPVRRKALADANELERVKLKQQEFQQIMDFLQALTDPASQDLRHTVPMKVPSGLPVFD